MQARPEQKAALKPTLDRFFERAFLLRDRLGAGGGRGAPAPAPAPAPAAGGVESTNTMSLAGIGSAVVPAAGPSLSSSSPMLDTRVSGSGGQQGLTDVQTAAGLVGGRTSQTMACCLFSFEAQQQGDLSFSAGDILQVCCDGLHDAWTSVLQLQADHSRRPRTADLTAGREPELVERPRALVDKRGGLPTELCRTSPARCACVLACLFVRGLIIAVKIMTTTI